MRELPTIGYVMRQLPVNFADIITRFESRDATELAFDFRKSIIHPGGRSVGRR